MSIFDLIVDREELLKLSDEEINSSLCNIFPERKLFSHSIDWRKSENFILKSKGIHGDVIIGWEGKHGKARENYHKGSIWNTQSHPETCLRSDGTRDKTTR